jgi:hypothetical protein
MGARAQDPFFIQMADPQFRMHTNNIGFAQETANLKFVIKTVNRRHPAFVVMSGDLLTPINREASPVRANAQRLLISIRPSGATWQVWAVEECQLEPSA